MPVGHQPPDPGTCHRLPAQGSSVCHTETRSSFVGDKSPKQNDPPQLLKLPWSYSREHSRNRLKAAEP